MYFRRRQWQPTTVLLPGKSHEWRSLVGCSPWGLYKSDTTERLHFPLFHFNALEKEMATHSSVLAWRIPGTGKAGGLPFMGLHRVRHDWSDLACMHALEKEMATHSSILFWRIPGMEEPGGLLSMGSHRVGHNWSDLAAVAAAAVHLKLTQNSKYSKKIT